MGDGRAFVPVPIDVPSRWRIIRRDSAAGLFAVFFVLGLAAATIYVVDATRPRRTTTTYYYTTPIPDPRSAIGVSWLVCGGLLALLLPLRVWRVRRLFRGGVEVAGRVETQHRTARSTTIKYRYEVGGTSYTGTYSLFLATTLAHNASVAVVIDPDRPSRSILKHAFILESVDVVPRARVHR